MKNQGINPFRLAKPHLAWTPDEVKKDGKTEFICQALAMVCEAGQLPTGLFDRARRMVMVRIDPYSSINAWLQCNRCVRTSEKTFVNTQFFRHRWLDHLADEWDQGIRK